MTALPEEVQEAQAEGADIRTLMAPDHIELDENGKVRAFWAQPQIISAVQRGGNGQEHGGEQIGGDAVGFVSRSPFLSLVANFLGLEWMRVARWGLRVCSHGGLAVAAR